MGAVGGGGVPVYPWVGGVEEGREEGGGAGEALEGRV